MSFCLESVEMAESVEMEGNSMLLINNFIFMKILEHSMIVEFPQQFEPCNASKIVNTKCEVASVPFNLLRRLMRTVLDAPLNLKSCVNSPMEALGVHMHSVNTRNMCVLAGYARSACWSAARSSASRKSPSRRA